MVILFQEFFNNVGKSEAAIRSELEKQDQHNLDKIQSFVSAVKFSMRNK